MSTSTASPTHRSPARPRCPDAPSRRRGEPKAFDFRRPTTLSREHVRTMQIVQETLARGITSTLASTLRAVSHVAVRDIEQCPYDEYARDLPNPALLTLLSLRPLGGSALLEIPLRIAYTITELMLGGRGGPDQPTRPMTDLELSLIRGVVELTLPEIRYAFEPVVSVEPTVIGQESNPQFAQLAAPTDMVIVISFDVRVETVHDVMTLCIPFSSLQPHLEALSSSANAGTQSPERLAQEQARLRELVAESTVEARAVFRPVVASSSQIVALAIGDVLLLNHPTAIPLTFEVDGVPVHDASIGRVSRHLALQIVDLVPPQRQRRRSRLQVLDGDPRAT